MSFIGLFQLLHSQLVWKLGEGEYHYSVHVTLHSTEYLSFQYLKQDAPAFLDSLNRPIFLRKIFEYIPKIFWCIGTSTAKSSIPQLQQYRFINIILPKCHIRKCGLSTCTCVQFRTMGGLLKWLSLNTFRDTNCFAG